MLKKIALTALFAITFAVGIGTAQAATPTTPKAPVPAAPVPQGFCPFCGC